MEKTRVTLLSRLKRTGDDRAWEEFFDRYAPVIMSYAQKRGLKEHLAEDVLQETMMVLMRELKNFEYDPQKGRFRNYLITIVHRRCIGAQRRAEREELLIELQPPHLLNNAIDQHAYTADEQMEMQWRQSMEDEAWRRVCCEPGQAERHVNAYDAYVRNGRAAADVAVEFGMTVNHVYQVKNQMDKKLYRELELLLEGLGEAVAS